MKRLLCCLIAFLLLGPSCALALEGLPGIGSSEEAMDYVDLPNAETGENMGVTRGRIRYIAQNRSSKAFVKSLWMGGEERSDLDLSTNKKWNGYKFAYYCENMCTRACYSMAISYLGIDWTPGAMSAALNVRDIDVPYDAVTEITNGLERVEGSSYLDLQDMIDRYLADSSFSPVVIHLLRENKTTHSLLIVGRTEEGKYVVVDPALRRAEGRQLFTQLIRISQNMQTIKGATYYSYKKADIYRCYQWHLTENSENKTDE